MFEVTALKHFHKILSPLCLRTESSEEPVQAEPQQACVSTAKGTAYSPSPSDGAVTPAQVGVWERIHSPKDSKNHLQMKLKLTSPDQKLLLPCEVQLVNMLTIPEIKTEGDDAAKTLNANNKSGRTIPKDLRRHQGPHTGHRLCCFTRCDNDVWRLQNIVTHSRDGYVCSNCGKAFKRRKILRRHERFHTGEKPYGCSKCSKTFALRKSLRRHLRFHTGERPHTCPQCGKSFRLRDNLKAHLRFHSGEKPFSCITCGKMFRIMRNMEKHKLSQCDFFVPSFRKIAGLSL
uniref:C2H2-type domain-containing protein n=1 Tax=Xiphophorus couchianus TaxID=32473 RepID=A0A3B5LHL8_9TELE